MLGTNILTLLSVTLKNTDTFGESAFYVCYVSIILLLSILICLLWGIRTTISHISVEMDEKAAVLKRAST